MNRKAALAALLLLSCAPASHSSGERVGPRADLYECEGCESINERSFDGLTWSAVVLPPGEPGERLILTGRVFKVDGRTPAAGVILYAYHTNSGGVYPTRGDEKGWGRRHGYLRAWVQTNESGDYRFETIRPGSYPTWTEPAHVHMILKEPARQEYWIDDVVFSDDPLLTDRYRARVRDRGGSGIVTPARDPSGAWMARRDIFLEP